MSFANSSLAEGLVFDMEIVCLEQKCTLVLKSKETRHEESRSFDNWHALRTALEEFISEQRLALADMKLEPRGHAATHNFAAVPLSRGYLEGLGFRQDNFDI